MIGTMFVLNIDAVREAAGLVVGDPQDWSVFPMGQEKRIYNSFDKCAVPLYEFLFTRIGFRMPFSDFKVDVLKHLKAAPSQLHPGSWAFMRVF